MNIDKPTEFIRNISVIVGIIIGGWFALEAIFATKKEAAAAAVVEVEREIDTGEKVRDYYQSKIEDGAELDKHEARRLRVNNNKLDRLYDELATKKQIEASLQ